MGDRQPPAAEIVAPATSDLPPVKAVKIRKRKRRDAGAIRQRSSGSSSSSKGASKKGRQSGDGDDGDDAPGAAATKARSADDHDGDDDKDDDDEEGESVTRSLAELRQEQKFRARKNGLEARKLMKAGGGEGGRSLAAAGGEDEDPGSIYGMKTKEEYEAQKAKDAIISGTAFQGGDDTTQKQEDKFMHDYVSKKLGVDGGPAGGGSPRSGGGGGGGDRDGARRPGMSEEDQLYLMPDHLKVDEANWKGSEVDGGQLLAGAGILEVTLPSKVKIDNIEASETMKQEMEMRRSARSDAQRMLAAIKYRDRELSDRLGVSAGGSYTANYSMHRKAYALQMRQQQRRGPSTNSGTFGGGGGGGGGGRGGGGGGRGGGYGGRQFESSDDRAFGRFQKRDRKR